MSYHKEEERRGVGLNNNKEFLRFSDLNVLTLPRKQSPGCQHLLAFRNLSVYGDIWKQNFLSVLNEGVVFAASYLKALSSAQQMIP